MRQIIRFIFHPIIHSITIRSTNFIPIPFLINLARNKVITTGTSVSNHTSQLITSVENNTVRAGRTTIVHIVIAQDRELVVGSGNGEVEALVVVVDVRVAVVGGTGLVQLVARGLGGAHGAAGVADCAAGVGAGALLGSGDGGADEEGGQSQDLELLLVFIMTRVAQLDEVCVRSYLGVLHFDRERLINFKIEWITGALRLDLRDLILRSIR